MGSCLPQVFLFLCMGRSHKEVEIQRDHNMSLPTSLPLRSLQFNAHPCGLPHTTSVQGHKPHGQCADTSTPGGGKPPHLVYMQHI